MPHDSFENEENWMGDRADPLEGFCWQSDKELTTLGINIWSDIFFDKQGMAIVLVDAQGIDDFRLMSLIGLMSSVQIFNTFEFIEDYQLQTYLPFRLIHRHLSLQKLIFLIRDLKAPANGKKLTSDEVLKNIFISGPQSIRKGIKTTYSKIDCKLLPRPSKSVATGINNYNGHWSKMNKEFFYELKAVIEDILKPEHCTAKKIFKFELTSFQYHECLFEYIKLFESNQPDIEAICETVFEQHIKNFKIPQSIEFFEGRCNRLRSYISDTSECRNRAFDYAIEDAKYDFLNYLPEKLYVKYKEMLENELKAKFIEQ